MSLFNKQPSAAALRGKQAGKLSYIRKKCSTLEASIAQCEQQILILADLKPKLIVAADLLPIIGALAFEKEKLKMDLTYWRNEEQKLIDELGDKLSLIESIIQRHTPN